MTFSHAWAGLRIILLPYSLGHYKRLYKQGGGTLDAAELNQTTGRRTRPFVSKTPLEEIEAASVYSATETPNVGTQACHILWSDLHSSTSHCSTARLVKLRVSALEYR